VAHRHRRIQGHRELGLEQSAAPDGARTLDAFPSFFFVRTRAAAQRVSAESVIRAIESSRRSIEQITVTPMDEIARNAFWRQELMSTMLSIFGLASLLLTAVGIYGVLAYLVGQRAREIGIRMALGARPRGVLGMVVRQGVEFVGAGVMLGVAGAYSLARAMRGLLFGVDPFDPILLTGVTAFLTIVAIAATVAPAIRAARIDPNALLRV
jgi:putative ABC transport system permease protein